MDRHVATEGHSLAASRACVRGSARSQGAGSKRARRHSLSNTNTAVFLAGAVARIVSPPPLGYAHAIYKGT